jgi:hypothetical protein
MASDFKRIFGKNGKLAIPACHSAFPACSRLGSATVILEDFRVGDA